MSGLSLEESERSSARGPVAGKKRVDFGLDGIVLIAKPAGLTSFEVLGPLKRALGTRRLGHTGTLDKFASGLLVVLVGKLTRLGPWFTSFDKVYEATILFGEETDTLDPEGAVIARAPAPSLEALAACLPAFHGRLMQSPPAYSAVHIDGERASERARRGERFDMKERPVVIHELELLSYQSPLARLRVGCSSGTYIRSLARDIAIAIGSRARLETLVRVHVGPFSLEQGVSPDSVSSDSSLLDFDPAMARSLGFSLATLPAAHLRSFRNGGRLRVSDLEMTAEPPPGSTVAVFADNSDFLGLVDIQDGRLAYRMVLPADQDREKP